MDGSDKINLVDLSIIIVSWNTRQLLDNCLDSIYKETGGVIPVILSEGEARIEGSRPLTFEIFVVDNASSDGSAEMVKEKYLPANGLSRGRLPAGPHIHLIENKKNAGFAAANNQALKHASGRYILFLNPDTIILENALDKGVQMMDQRQEIAILGAKTFNSGLTRQKTIAPSPNLLSQIFLLTKLGRLFPKSKIIKKYRHFDFDYDKESYIDGHVQGSFMLLRKEVLDKIGPFDEKFFIWFEEVDLCFRAIKAGYKILYSPEIKIIHYGGESFKQIMILKKQRMYNRSLFYYFWKNKPHWQYYILRLFEIPSLLLAAIAGIIKTK